MMESAVRRRAVRSPGRIRPGLARRPHSAFGARMESHPEIGGLQRVFLNERSRLLRFLQARGAGEEAEDVLHDLWQRLASAGGQPIADPVSYLFRALENVMRDRRRSDVSRDRRQQDWYQLAPDAGDEPQGERVLIARERLRRAEAVLAALGSRVETVFRRYRLDGMGQAVIARELGVSLSSVEKDLQKAYRALAELREKFDAE
jgi:RNA polymerase sigma factor (sigma-70 family)